MISEIRKHGLNWRNLERVFTSGPGVRREALRACVFLLARRITPFLGVEHDGVRYVLSPRESTGVCFPTFIRGYFDESTVRAMIVALTQHTDIAAIGGLSVLEIGANIGTETVSLLVRHGVKRVTAIEPDPENVRFLRANLALNGVQDQVTIHEMALSDINGAVVLEHSATNWGDHRVRVAGSSQPPMHEENSWAASEVPAQRLDSLLESGDIDLADIDLVWMDAQGHEAHILDGARLLAPAGTPIITEYWPYGLRRADSLERFHAIVAERYDSVVDLRRPESAFPAVDIAKLASRYAADEHGDTTVPYTDLLLLKEGSSTRRYAARTT